MSLDVLFMLGVVVLFFALTVIPQFIQRRKHEQELSSILPGAWVVTAGGIVGQVLSMDGQFVKLRISLHGEMLVARQAIRSRVAAPRDLFEAEEDTDPSDPERDPPAT